MPTGAKVPTAPVTPGTKQGHKHGALFNGDYKLSALNLLPDIMHTKYLGCDQYAYGSALHQLVYRHMSLDEMRMTQLSIFMLP